MPKYSLAANPIFASGFKTIIPACELPKPSSSSAQIIPSDTSPLIFDFFIVKDSSPLYSSVPMVATVTFCPAETLGAPHTMCNNSSAPISTVVMLNLSASGCLMQVFTSPITIPSKPPFTVSVFSMLSTSNPQAVNNSAALSAVISMLM